MGYDPDNEFGYELPADDLKAYGWAWAIALALFFGFMAVLTCLVVWLIRLFG